MNKTIVKQFYTCVRTIHTTKRENTLEQPRRILDSSAFKTAVPEVISGQGNVRPTSPLYYINNENYLQSIKYIYFLHF